MPAGVTRTTLSNPIVSLLEPSSLASVGEGTRSIVSLYSIVDPSTGELVREYPVATDDQIEKALARAQAAYRGWIQESTLAERVKLLQGVADLHTERRDELADLIVREMGKPKDQALGEIDFVADIYAYYAENAETFLADESIDLRAGEGTAVIRRGPVGVLLGIMPWNFPYYQVARFAGPNVLIGNPVLLKHAPQCPESAAAIEKIYADAGFPVGMYTNIYASNEQVETIIGDPRVQGVSLTGSERAGSAVAAIAGKNLKKVVLELGGSDPFLLLSTDDLDATVEAAVAARMDNGGQACNAAKRFIVVDKLYEAFVERFASAMTSIEPGNPSAADTLLGPMSSVAAAERLEEQVARAVAQGATLVRKGERNGAFVPPAVLTNVGADNDVRHEELFGPIAIVHRVADETEAVTVANETPFGLGSYVFTTDNAQALRVAESLDAGMVFVNLVGADGAELPFGGVKRSGFGRELGRFGAEEFVNKKLIRVG